MTDIVINYVRHRSYLDSVALMQFSKKLARLSGVDEAAIMMATPGNLQVMADAKLLDESDKSLDGGDMIIAIRADTKTNAESAIEIAKNLLVKPKDRLVSGFSWPLGVAPFAVQAPLSLSDKAWGKRRRPARRAR